MNVAMIRKLSISSDTPSLRNSNKPPANEEKMKFFKTLLLLSVTLMLSACSSDSGNDPNALTGSEELPSVETSAPPAEAQQETRAASSGTDKGSYHGRTNGNRPTWYFPKNMSQYPSTFTVSIAGCSSFRVANNGKRYVTGGYIVKQSHVSGRGVALLAPSSCGSRVATITY